MEQGADDGERNRRRGRGDCREGLHRGRGDGRDGGKVRGVAGDVVSVRQAAERRQLHVRGAPGQNRLGSRARRAAHPAEAGGGRAEGAGARHRGHRHRNLRRQHRPRVLRPRLHRAHVPRVSGRGRGRRVGRDVGDGRVGEGPRGGVHGGRPRARHASLRALPRSRASSPHPGRRADVRSALLEDVLSHVRVEAGARRGVVQGQGGGARERDRGGGR